MRALELDRLARPRRATRTRLRLGPERAHDDAAVRAGARRAVLCGSASRPSTSSSTALTRRLQQPRDPRHRDPHPVGPVVELVAQLVDRLLELEQRAAAASKSPGPAGRCCESTVVQVAGEELVARALLPVLGRRRRRASSRRRGGVGERAQHPGDVAQRRALAPPLGQRRARARPRSRSRPSRRRPRAPGRGGSRRGGGSRGPAAPTCEISAQPLAHLLAAPGDRRERLGRRAGRGRARSISSSTVADSSASASGARLLGRRTSGSVGSDASTVCIAPVTSPSRRRRPRKASGSRASASSASSQPSPASGTKSCSDPERRVHRRAGYCVPAVERGDVREAVLGEEAEQLELRVDARPRGGGRA